MGLRSIIICINLMSFAVYAAHQDMTPTDRVNKILSEHPELYNFDADEYAGQPNADKRLKKFKERQNRIIKNELLDVINETIKTIIDINTFDIFGCKINRGPIGDFGKNLLDLVAKGMKIGLWPPNALEDVGGTAEKVINFYKIPIDAICNVPSYKSKVSELRVLIRDIKRVLGRNTLNNTEEKVVRRWHEFPAGMRETLINNLLLLRSPHKNVRDLTAARQKIENCLNIPYISKPLIPNSEGLSINDFAYKKCAYVDGMFANPPWSLYSPETKDQLKSAITEMCDAPYKEMLGVKTSRKIWYFHGEPGTGKSKAAKEIAAKFELPFIEIGASTSDELSQKNLTGNSAFELEKKLGLLFQPLFATDKNRKNWKNAVVIIDEFDRLIKKKVELFLWLFDPDLREVKCDYLGKEVVLDISQITFILTANTDLGQNAFFESAKHPDELKALRDRLLFVRFDQFNKESLKELLKEHIRNNRIFLVSNFEESEENINKIVDFALNNNPDQTLRKLRQVVENLANDSKNTWDGKQKQSPASFSDEDLGANQGDPASSWSTPMQSYSGVNNILDLINGREMIESWGRGKNIKAAVVDTGINFDDERLKGKELKIDDIRFLPPNDLKHGTNTALILAGSRSGDIMGIAPGLKIASYWGIATHEALEHAKKLDVKIANVSIVGQTPASLHFGNNNDIADIAVVVIAGNDQQQETTMAKGLGDNYYPEYGNIIVTVAVDSMGNLTRQSSKCGKTKNFCVAVPSTGTTSETAPIVSGALAMLMEAHPGLTASYYVDAILKTASNNRSPNDKTGMGMLDVGAAYLYLNEHSPKNPSSFQNPPPNVGAAPSVPRAASVQNPLPNVGSAPSVPRAASVQNAGVGKIRIIAGTGTAGNYRSHSPLRNELDQPRAIAVAADGHIYFTEAENHRVMRISPDGNTLERFAGTGYAGKKLSTKNRKATELNRPSGIALQHDGDVVIADSLNKRLLCMRPNVTWSLYTHGWGTPRWFNSKKPLAARHLVADANDNLIAADSDNHRIVEISYNGKEVWTIAGTGEAGSQRKSQLNTPRGVAITPNGEIVIADTNNHRILMLSRDRKSIKRLAGCGQGGSIIINNEPWRSELYYPVAVAVSSKGSILIADTHNHRILELSPDHQSIRCIAGTGQSGSALNEDNPMATSLKLPMGIAVTRDDEILIADTGNHRILKLDIAQ